ncbi:MAG TPA: PASTA domain-containing protein [Terriglobales bacterium]|jgi:beta-lactam-binding protein with PASTA domain|nr:PASTA domain-containing protein [Terriglobales bacterium]
MLRIFRLMLLTLILMLVALVSALITMRFAIHGREVEIPKVIGMTTGAARDQLGSHGLRLAVEDRFYSSEVPEGRVVSQLPQPGTKVRRGWVVRVAESLGPQRAMVPDVIGQSERAAEINLQRRGLDVGTVAQGQLPGFPDDQVISQSPPPNANTASPKVSLLVNSAGGSESYVMPDFTGKRLGDAARVIEQAGLHIAGPGNSLQNGSLSPEAAARNAELAWEVIVRQSPSAGQRVTADTAIRFEVVKEGQSNGGNGHAAPAPANGTPGSATPAPASSVPR